MLNEILLFSGGLDSYIAWHYLSKPQTVYFSIKHRYDAIEQEVIKQLIPTTFIDNSLYLGDQEKKDAFIPFRNIYLMMMATKYSSKIYLGGVKEDRISDNTEESFLELSEFLSKYSGRKIEVLSPFRHLMKWEIVKWYLDNNLSLGYLYNTVSCYSGKTLFCGGCKSCFRKWVAFVKNKLPISFSNDNLKQEYKLNAKKSIYSNERNKLILELLGD